MDNSAVVSAFNELMPDSKVLSDIHSALQVQASEGKTIVYVDNKPKTIATDISVKIIKKSFSMAYLPNEASTINVLLAINFDPSVITIEDYDPEQHFYGVVQYDAKSGQLYVIAFQTDYWYC